MKLLLIIIITFAIVRSSCAQHPIDVQVEDRMIEHGLDEALLLELDRIRLDPNMSADKRSKKWNKKYTKWDKNQSAWKINIASIIIKNSPVESGSPGDSSYTGYCDNYLLYTLDLLEQENAISNLSLSFLKNLLHKGRKSERNQIQQDINSIVNRADRLGSETPISTRDFRKITDFIWEKNPELIGAKAEDIVASIESYSVGKLMDFISFAEAKGLSLSRLNNPSILGRFKVVTDNGNQLLKTMEKSYEIFSFSPKYRRPRMINKWKPFEYIKYREFIENHDVRNIFLGLLLLNKWQQYVNKNLDNSITGKSIREQVGLPASKLLRDIEAATLSELRLHFQHKTHGKSDIEQMLIAASNEMYFLLPEAEYSFVASIRNADVFSFDLTEEARSILLEVSAANGIGYNGVVLLRDESIYDRLDQDPSFRLGLYILLAQHAYYVKNDWYKRTVDSDPFNKITSREIKIIYYSSSRLAQRDEVKKNLIMILKKSGVESGEYRLIYSESGDLCMHPKVSARVEIDLRRTIAVSGIQETKEMGTPSYTRFVIDMNPTLEELENNVELVSFVPDDNVKRIEEQIESFPDLDPTFPGGEKALQEYLKHTISYPKEAIENEEQGKVYISFVVEKDGTLNQIKVERGVSPSIDREAIRLIEKMPNWIPGKSNGMIVRIRYRLPIQFIFK